MSKKFKVSLLKLKVCVASRRVTWQKKMELAYGNNFSDLLNTRTLRTSTIELFQKSQSLSIKSWTVSSRSTSVMKLFESLMKTFWVRLKKSNWNNSNMKFEAIMHQRVNKSSSSIAWINCLKTRTKQLSLRWVTFLFSKAA